MTEILFEIDKGTKTTISVKAVALHGVDLNNRNRHRGTPPLETGLACERWFDFRPFHPRYCYGQVILVPICTGRDNYNMPFRAAFH